MEEIAVKQQMRLDDESTGSELRDLLTSKGHALSQSTVAEPAKH